ncbi:MAG: F0F1 ATP synthase subunit A [Burkholderiaceae bacterium]|nr:F0F1 ATP synthase subunit A [Burkholderiaceae bacterium]MDH3459857.1 F0F1 ATP synthase subunit A [Burkholderiaceae bacterium]
MAAQGHAPNASEYIAHHLQHLQNKPQASIVDFSVFNLDSIAFSVLLGVLVCWTLWSVARKVTSGVPGRMQAAVEWLVEMVDNQAKSIVHNARSRKLVAPLALTVFIWVFMMNAMDLLPVDALPVLWQWLFGVAGHNPEHAYLRVVATADLSVTMGLSITVLLMCLIYNVKIKGVAGWLHELFTAPFGSVKPSGNPLTWVAFAVLSFANFAMQLIEFVAKTVSHGMRLFGNMYAGELIFMLIALMGGAWALSATGLALFVGHVVAGTVWAIFHILIITLQAFVFMMLTLVYVGQAHDHH